MFQCPSGHTFAEFMSGDVAIRVENLGKKFLIGHQVEGDLRGSFAGKVRRLLGRSNGQSQEEFWALKDVSFEIKKGEAVGIIGRNGAGKSTLLKILSRITDPTTGRFEINGRVSSLLEVGTGFHSELTGRENIYLNGTILGMKRAEIKKKFDAIVDFSGVEKFLDTPVKHYSSGMKVRLAFSVAAHLEPEILIIDEVLAVGDAEFQKKCLGKMDEVSKNEGRTVLFVSHNMGAVQNLCSKGIFLKEGRLAMEGSTDNVIKEYLRKQLLKAHYNGSGSHHKKIFFKEISLRNEEGILKDEFFHDEDIFVQYDLVYNIDKFNHDYNIFCIVLDHLKSRVFSAESKIITKERVVLRINRNFLTRGYYSLHTFINKPQTEQLDVAEDVCAFSVVDNGSFFNVHGSYDYGRVFPNTNWIY